MIQWIPVLGHVTITIIALVAFAFRIEHRLTKIETDLSWIKKNGGSQCKEKLENGKSMDVD